MNLLLDTHILLWHLADNPKLSFEASDLIENDAHQNFEYREFVGNRNQTKHW